MCTSTRVRPAATQLLTFVIFLTALLLPGHRLNAEMVDRVVAVVNDDIITLSDVEKEGEKAFRQIAANTPSDQLPAQLAKTRAEILDALIDKHLINQKAKAQKITVTDGEVDAAFQNVMKMTHMTREQLLAKIDEAGMDEETYRSTLRTQLLQNKLVGTDVSAKIVITEDMILDYYDNHYVSRSTVNTSPADGGYYLLQIGCSWQKGGKNEARKRVEKAHDLAKGGEDFGSLAREFSDLPSRVDGGDIGTFELDDMAADMRHAIDGLKAGEISEIVETSSGFQFFKVLAGGDAGETEGSIVAKAPYEEVKDSIKQELFQQEIKKAYAQWVKELKDQAYIEKL